MVVLTVEIVKEQADLRDKYYADQSVSHDKFVRNNLHDQIKFLLNVIENSGE